MKIKIRPYNKRGNTGLEADISIPGAGGHLLLALRRRVVVPENVYSHLAESQRERACVIWASSNASKLIGPKPTIPKAIREQKESAERDTTTLNKFYPKFQEIHLATKSPATQLTQNRLYRLHLKEAVGNVLISDLKEEKLAKLLADLSVKTCGKPGPQSMLDPKYKRVIEHSKAGQTLQPDTVNSIIGLLMTMLDCAYRWGYINRKPDGPDRLDNKQDDKIDRSKFYDKKQYKAIVRAAMELGLQQYVFVLLGLDAGLRVGEICALRWENVLFAEKKIAVKEGLIVIGNGEKGEVIKKPKMNKTGLVNAPVRLIRALEKLYSMRAIKTGRILQRQDLARSGMGRGIHKSGPINPTVARYWTYVITRAASKIDPRIVPNKNPHRFRHTCATRIADATNSIFDVRDQLRHGNITTSQIYCHSERSESILKALDESGEDLLPQDGALVVLKGGKTG